MKILGITYYNDIMTKSGKRCADSMTRNGIGCVSEIRPAYIDENFARFNEDILKKERGAGYWLWKPYIIYCGLLSCVDDAYIFYSDAGVELVSDIKWLINNMDESGIHLFGNMWQHTFWCKGDAIWEINKLEEYPEGVQRGYEKELQCQASCMLFKNTARAREFVKEWLLYCQMPGLIDDSPSKTRQNWTGFQEHRHDQAILTCLAIKHGIKRHWWPAAYNNGQFTYDKRGYEPEKYPVMFNHHMKRNDQWT